MYIYNVIIFIYFLVGFLILYKKLYFVVFFEYCGIGVIGIGV